VILTGPLVCYDPYGRNATNCRRFFPKDDAHYAVNLTSICVDSKGKILVGASGSRLLVVSHDGNPIKNGVTVVREETNIDVSKMSAGPDGITWIATGKGLYRYQSDSNTIRLTSVQKPVNSVAAENERIVWLGTPSDGLIRYDVVKEDTMTVGINSGLVSNSVTDLSIDHKGGYLWVATAEGVSRYYLGHSNTPVSGNASIVAFPNPFSQSNPRHRMIIFKHCSPDARVLVYSMSGALVAKLSRETSSFNSLDDNMFESTLCWTPPKKLTPGVYYFVGAGQKPVATKKLFIIP
jgi:ligand-binding sensor domain-containing protein